MTTQQEEIIADAMVEGTSTKDMIVEAAKKAGVAISGFAKSSFSAIIGTFPDVLHWVMRIFWEAVLPLMVLYGVYKFILFAYDKIMELYVSGKPNEWVLILNNGELKHKGIGLSCFRGPFDQVAVFPANVHQVNFTAEQVTSEMQGVQVSGMIVWSINRQGDGPFKAYTNLGSDLASGNPKTANQVLVSMSEAIVRTAIAGSSTKQLLQEREKLRQQIRSEMFDVVKGWGVWLETVEITDVLIKSQPVFKDMQAEYREKLKRVAEIYRVKVRSEIEDIRAVKESEMHQKQIKIDNELTQYSNDVKMKLEQLTRKNGVRVAVQDLKIQDFKTDFNTFYSNQNHLHNTDFCKLNSEEKICKVKTNGDKKVVNRQEELANNTTKVLAHDSKIVIAKLRDDAVMVREKQMADLKKKNIDKSLLTLQALETAEDCLKDIYFKKMQIQQENDDNDAATALFNKWFQSRAVNV